MGLGPQWDVTIPLCDYTQKSQLNTDIKQQEQ